MNGLQQVIPFLPLEREHVAEVVKLKLDQLAAQGQGKHWHKLSYTPELVHYMASSKQVQYLRYQVEVDVQGHAKSQPPQHDASSSTGADATLATNPASSAAPPVRSKIFAKYGARNVDSGGPVQRLKAKLLLLAAFQRARRCVRCI